MVKKKILHLITNLETGGAQKMLSELLPLLQKSFNNQVCCLRGHGTFGENLREKGIIVHYFFMKNIVDFSIIFKFKEVIKKEKPDILVTYLTHSDIFGRILGRLFGVKKIVCSVRVNTLKLNFPLFVMDGLTSSLVDYYHFNSKYVKRIYQKYFFLSNKKCTYIPNGISNIERYNIHDNHKIFMKKRELNIPEDKIIIGSIARLDKQKGQTYLVSAFAEIIKKRKDTVLLLIGQGKERKNIKRQINLLNLEDYIYMVGERKDIPELLQVIDVFVSPSLFEGMSNTLLEAMASKKTIVATNIPENTEILRNNISALLFKKRNVSELTKNILRTLSDSDLKKRLSLNAHRDVLNNYNFSVIADKFLEILKNV